VFVMKDRRKRFTISGAVIMGLPLMGFVMIAIGTKVIAADLQRQAKAVPGVFTAAQARAGKVAYESSCGLCHRAALQGRTGAPGELPDVNTLPAKMLETIDQSGGQVPPLAGAVFMAKWGAKSTKEFTQRVANAVSGFPPKGKDEDTYLLLTAYFLRMNGGRAGGTALTAQTDVPLTIVTGR
jgi:mono/diheme cytochrome c family protein